MELFRAYVPTKNKKCTMQFKGVPSSQLMTYDEVKNLQEYAGILANDVYLRYSTFCSQSQLQALSKIAFSKSINKRLGTNTVSRRIMVQ